MVDSIKQIKFTYRWSAYLPLIITCILNRLWCVIKQSFCFFEPFKQPGHAFKIHVLMSTCCFVFLMISYVVPFCWSSMNNLYGCLSATGPQKDSISNKPLLISNLLLLPLGPLANTGWGICRNYVHTFKHGGKITQIFKTSILYLKSWTV